MATETFYRGSLYANEPSYKIKNPYFSPTGYSANFSSLSMAMDARTANQLKEVSETLNTGIKSVEVGPVDPGVFESIPKEHFKEMNRLAKLSGKNTEITFHAPMVDPTGITQHGYDKAAQDDAERQLWNAIKKSAELNPKGTIVTFHAASAGLPSAELVEKDENGKTRVKSMIIIEPNSGQVMNIAEEKSFFESDKPNEYKLLSPKEKLKQINEEQWMQKLSSLGYYVERSRPDLINGLNNLKAKEQLEKEKKYEEAKLAENEANSELSNAKIYLREGFRNLKSLYDDIYNKKISDEDRKKLDEFRAKAKPYVDDPNVFAKLEKDPKKLAGFAEVIQTAVRTMGSITHPEIYTPIKDFAIQKSAETTANLAWKAYNDPELRKNNIAPPIIALENHPAQTALLTTGSELRSVVDEARKKFVEKGVASGMSSGEAKKQAEKIIGATWDVGHINMMRRYGFTEADIVKETENLTKNGKSIVKKVHLSDNFGYEHTELPMGMGNVPMNEIMKKIGKEGYDVKKVIEAGNWWQHFSGGKGGGPLIPTLGGMGVQVYGGYGANWNQVYGASAPYFSGYGTMLPDMNFQTYGAGFSSLPMELGGQIAGRDSKFSGTPMA